MNKVITAEEFYYKSEHNLTVFKDDVPELTKLMIEFAKLHLNNLGEQIENGEYDAYWIDNVVEEYIEQNIK